MENGSWRELAGRSGAVSVLAGGVLVGAVTIYVAASLLPTAVAEIGGTALYAWSMTVYLTVQVVATMFVGRLLSGQGTVRSYLLGAGVFAAGSMLCAMSPSMPVLVAGRGIQGLGAGLLTGLGFAVLHSALPPHLWARGSAVISAMFGVGNLVGPALGGLCAQFGSWRWAFVALAAYAVLLGAGVRRVLPPGQPDGTVIPVPVVSLVLVVCAVGAVSTAGIVSGVAQPALLALGFALLVAFVVAERRSAVTVLPRSACRRGSALRWIYPAIAFLAAGVAVEGFLPLFGQRLGGLAPVAAGFLAAVLSLGWAVGQILATPARRAGLLIVAGPVVLTGCFVLLAIMHRQPPLLWLPVLLLGGAGIGVAMPHLSVAAMAEGEQAAAGIATVLTMAIVFGSAVAGVLVNLGDSSTVDSAGYLMAGFALIAGCGVLVSAGASPRWRSPSR
ncbi:MFS transporter [Pseudonocardiaceae bacterium YIM PH 21723]|nr:MFS transporter [Pseudonocardiaceae bacterium YIM PH 21723]